MTLSFVNSALTDQIVKALCNTLVNSLWQGLILAAVAGLIVIGTKRASSALRYNLLIAALVVFALGTLLTFGLQLQKVDYTTASSNQIVNAPQQNIAAVQNYTGPVAVQSDNLMSVITGYLNTYHNTIVLIWFLIICAKSIQLGVGLYGTYRLKHTYVVAAGGFWNERVKQLAAMLGIDQGINLLESGLAKVPMVIGHLKPVILIPIGLLTALSAEEVEAILVHELAHIKRRDYLVNMLQSLMEIVFFFNPAVLWISQLIKTERENCCDDMVLEQSSNKINYIRALVSCEEYQAAVPAYAMAFPGSKNSLLDRVKRLASNRNHSLNLYEKTILAICLVVSGLCMSAFAEKENIKRVVHHITKAFEHSDVSKSDQELAKQSELLNGQTATVRKNTELLQAKSTGLELLDTNKKFHLNVNVDPITVTVPAVNVNVNPVNIDTKFTLSPVDVHLSPLNVQVPDFKVNVNTDFKLNVVPDVKVQLNNVNVHMDPVNVSLGSLGGPLGAVRVDVDTNKKAKGKGAVSPSSKGKGASASPSANGSYSYSTSSPQSNSSSSGTSVAAPKANSYSYSYSNASPSHISISYSYSGKNGNYTYSDDSTNKYDAAKASSNSYSYSNSSANTNSYSKGSHSYSYSYSGDTINKKRAILKDLAPGKMYESPNPTSVKLVDELVNAHLVTDKNKLTVTLNNRELVINGVKQTEANHQLMMRKFSKNANENVNINYTSYNNQYSYTPKTATIPSLADELIKAGLMTQKDKGKDSFSAHLDDKELVINGVKQSEENHQAILKKFSQHPGGGVNVFYNYSSDPKKTTTKPANNKGAWVPSFLQKLNEKKDKHDTSRLAATKKINGVFAQIKDRQNEVANELLKENIITDTKNLNFSLTNEELVVNGMKQPAEIHRRIISKYVKGPGDIVKLSYGNPTK